MTLVTKLLEMLIKKLQFMNQKIEIFKIKLKQGHLAFSQVMLLLIIIVNICNAMDNQDDSDAHKNDNISCMEIVPDVTFVACIYDLRWCIGIVKQESAEHGDYLVSFMIPSGEAKLYYWPGKKDIC